MEHKNYKSEIKAIKTAAPNESNNKNNETISRNKKTNDSRTLEQKKSK